MPKFLGHLRDKLYNVRVRFNRSKKQGLVSSSPNLWCILDDTLSERSRCLRIIQSLVTYYWLTTSYPNFPETPIPRICLA